MITRLLNRLRRTLWRRLSDDPQHVRVLTDPAPEDEVEWSADDRARALTFLKSETGRKLLQLLRSREEILKTAACSEHEKRVDHARGKAVGYRQAVATLIVLTAPPTPKEEENPADDSDDGAEALRNRHSV